MRIYTLILIFCLGAAFQVSAQGENNSNEQSQRPIVRGKVLNAKDESQLENVNIVNLNSVKGTITNAEGNFEIAAAVNDTLYFSYLGFETINVRVTEDWLKFGDVTISMTEKGIALEEVTVTETALTGFLEIDAKRAPIYATRRYKISGLPKGYEAGDSEPGAITKVLSSVFNPADFLYNTFGKKGKSMRKLRQIKEQDEIRNLLQSKYDRETLMNLLQMDKVDIDAILRNCQYSKKFIEESNDLQILDAISECYEEYKVLKTNSAKKEN
ncbi:carboxypeptidase-like regulatory domain-containing protein [Nonlabens xiamenensis]|uniref:carboxypeptidase-like regulatory domain-containing protein n=1 Tax=Nonlabens xiamenensis TaxID=2341043 RepID=UPI000F60E474|nr:carboxypeptidase-like regulatory domain-containing protein [Nonlabens xiamenensis]